MTDFAAAVEIKPGRKYLITLGESWEPAPGEENPAVDQMARDVQEAFPASEFVFLTGVTGIAEAADD